MNDAADLLLPLLPASFPTPSLPPAPPAPAAAETGEGGDASTLPPTPPPTDSSASTTAPIVLAAQTPEQLLRSGALGSRVAAAVVAAMTPVSADERQAGIEALHEVLIEETQRVLAASHSVIVSSGEDSGGVDELLLRLTLVMALLDGRREAEALEQAGICHKFYAHEMQKGYGNQACPAVSLMLAKCQLRLGKRAEGLASLEEAEAASCDLSPTSTTTTTGNIPVWLHGVWKWGHTEASRMLLAHRAAEKCRAAAVETYARGSFIDASLLYGRAIALLQAGCAEDKRGRATALADRAGICCYLLFILLLFLVNISSLISLSIYC